MCKKISLAEYTRRKLLGVKKARHRKKIHANAENLFTDYCIKYWGSSGLFHVVYSEHLSNLVYSENPFLELVQISDTSFTGRYCPTSVSTEVGE